MTLHIAVALAEDAKAECFRSQTVRELFAEVNLIIDLDLARFVEVFSFTYYGHLQR